MLYTQKKFYARDEIVKSYDLCPIKNINSEPKRKWKKYAKANPNKEAAGNGGIKEFIAKLSRGLMLPIAMLPIAGLFLGIGSAIINNANGNEALSIFGKVLQIPGNAVFANLPILFCVAIAITFTGDAGTAGLSAVIGWIIFCALQSVFIQYNTTTDNFTFLFYQFTDVEFQAIFTENVGINSLQTSVFGGLAIGAIVAVLYNKFKNIKMPTSLSFFSGVRFIPIITFTTTIIVSLGFCIVWPLIGKGLYLFGGTLSKMPLGINSLIFGYGERALVPFGLHHAFYIPLWQTSVGGQINLLAPMILNGQTVEGYTTWFEFGVDHGIITADSLTTIVGDQNSWTIANQLSGLSVTLADGSKYIINMKDFVNVEGFSTANPGQYMQGKYPFMIFGLPAAAAAIIMAAPKGQNRKLAFSAVFGSALTTFLTGITEPIEFTFLFLAPGLFWGFHAIFCAISFWLLNIWHTNMGMTFSAGLIDFSIYGILPDVLGAKADCWKAIIVGLAYIPIYFFGFWIFIVKRDINTPGRGSTTTLFTKKDYQAKKSANNQQTQQMQQATANEINVDLSKLNDDQKLALSIINVYGGKNNIVNVDACITKLRVQVKDASIIKDEDIIALGAHGVTRPSKTSVYAVFGTKADIIKNNIKDLLNKK